MSAAPCTTLRKRGISIIGSRDGEEAEVIAGQYGEPIHLLVTEW